MVNETFVMIFGEMHLIYFLTAKRFRPFKLFDIKWKYINITNTKYMFKWLILPVSYAFLKD